MRLTLNDIYEDIRNNEFLTKIELSNHVEQKHIGWSDTQMLDRALNENKSVSSFKNKNDYLECLQYTICDNFQEIKEQLRKRKDQERFIVTTKFDDNLFQSDDPVDFNTHHKGIMRERDGKVYEVDTNQVCVMLMKDKKSPYGMSVITCYPDLITENIEKTGKDLSKIVDKTKFYENGNATARLFAKLATTDCPYQIFHKQDPSYNTLSINFPSKKSDNMKYQMRLSDDYSNLKLAYTDTFRNNKWTTKNLRADERINFLLNYQEEQQYIEKQERNLETLKKEVNEDRLKKIRIDKESITKDKELELD